MSRNRRIQVSLRINPELHPQLKVAARQSGRTLNAEIKKCIEERDNARELETIIEDLKSLVAKAKAAS